jgi:hypothetical protein
MGVVNGRKSHEKRPQTKGNTKTNQDLGNPKTIRVTKISGAWDEAMEDHELFPPPTPP